MDRNLKAEILKGFTNLCNKNPYEWFNEESISLYLAIDPKHIKMFLLEEYGNSVKVNLSTKGEYRIK